MSVRDYTDGGIPKTIEELKDYCNRNGLSASKTRFFIDYDYRGAKAFGIYKDEETGEFVVYKNKADGSRAERYRGTDEEFAVVELYDRLQSEITNQKLSYAADMAERERTKYERNSGLDAIKGFDINKYPVRNGLDDIFDDKYEEDTSYSYSGSHSGSGSFSNNPIIIMGIILFVCVFLLFGLSHGKSGGYSGYNNNSGYNYNYDNDSNWNSDSWNNSDSWDSWGSDSWDSDSWDSGFTDWDSDW